MSERFLTKFSFQHMDIKPSNIILSEELKPRVIDMQLTETFPMNEKKMLISNQGTPQYQSLYKKRESNYISKKRFFNYFLEIIVGQGTAT